jgi:hypothetical protein
VENVEDVPVLDGPDIQSHLDNVFFTQADVMKKLKTLNPGKSPGPDGLHPRVLKELADALAEPLALLFNKSLSEGKLPSMWKDADVTPLFKKGDKSKTNNYRPVSLTSVVCKIMESIIRDHVIEHLHVNNCLSQCQHGFIAKRSCVTNLLAALDKWTDSLDEGAPVDVVYLDFAKAFDSVPHQRLISKLNSYGIISEVQSWITDFLVGRRQRVHVNGSFSDWSEVTSGVPQGSVLGPVLFVIFINDLPDVVDSLCEMYADDTKLFDRVDSLEGVKKIQKDLDNLVTWADQWQLRFNVDKCQVLHFGSNNPCREYSMRKHGCDERVVLGSPDCERDLGVIIDRDLKFAEHIENQVNKANRLVGLIRRSFTYLNADTLKQLFIALVRPHLEFANVVWSPMFQKDKDLIESVLRRATKVIQHLKDLSYEERLRHLKLPSMKYRRERGDMIEVYKFTHGLYSVNKELLELDRKQTGTRGHMFKLAKKRCRINMRQHFFSFRVVDKWNNLPAAVVEAPSLDSFKNRLDTHWATLKYCV